MMKKFNKRLVSLLASLVIVMQSSLVSATLMDYELEFSSVDDVVVGESFDVEVFVDTPEFSELLSFGFDFVDFSLSNVSLVGFTPASWIVADINNDVAGITDPFLSSGFFGDDVFLATLHFTADAVGSETVEFYGAAPTLLEPTGLVFFDQFNDGSVGGSFDVNVTAASVSVPEPSSLAIML
jgi:hypothetical protein